MQISSAITAKLNFINISANINRIQIIIVSTPRFSWTRNIYDHFQTVRMYRTWIHGPTMAKKEQKYVKYGVRNKKLSIIKTNGILKLLEFIVR